MKRGFTLVEMMFAVSIFAVVIGSLGVATIGLTRMVGRAYAEAELSVRLRTLREKLLFHAQPTDDVRAYAGLLSSQPKEEGPAVESGVKINVLARAVVLQDGSSVTQRIELVRDADVGGSRYFKNDGADEPWRGHWLRLDGMGEAGRTSASLDYLDGETYLEDRTLERKHLYFITLSASLPLGLSGERVTHAERIAVPVFGTEQVKNETAVFHDDLLP